MTIQPGKSRGKDKLKGEIEIARRRIWEAEFIGWPALAESWMDTLQEKLNDHEKSGASQGTSGEQRLG